MILTMNIIPFPNLGTNRLNDYRDQIVKFYSTITVTILLISILFVVDYSLGLSNNNNNNKIYALEQTEIIGNTPNSSTTEAPSTDMFNLTSGYTIEPVVWNLTAPDSLTFDDSGNMYLGEAGYPFTDLPQVPRILKVTPNGNISILVDTNLSSPIVDVVFYNEMLYVSHKSKISTIDITNGTVKDIIVGLPGNGDHQSNQIAFGHDAKRLYVCIGTATNSGVIGEDNYRNGWLAESPNVQEIPGKNIELTGQNFVTPNPLTAKPNDNATTGAFVPFNTSTYKGQIVPGNIKCNGCILSANLDGTDLKLELRTPSGIAFNEEGRLFAVDHGSDERGSRPIANDNDKFHEIKINETGSNAAFYGWPNFFGNAEPVTDPKFQSKRGVGEQDKLLQFLMQNHPKVEKPLALFKPPHTSAIQMAFANESFGFAGESFVAQFGTNAPISRPLPPPGTIIGQNIVHVNIDNKTISDFLTLNEVTTAFRPTDVVFNQNGTDLFVVDWGNVIYPPGKTIPNSGVVWKITPTNLQ